MLWLGLHFPALPVELFTRGAAIDSPLAVSDGHATSPRIVACNAAAAERGIRPRLTLNAAYALDGHLTVQPRNEDGERAALERLAGWAYQYTSRVCLLPPQTLLLEIGGSLRLFGGRASLCQHIENDLTGLGYTARFGMAPTPLGTQWLARTDSPGTVTHLEGLPEALDPLPLSYMDLDEEMRQALNGMGVHTIGECRRLPRDGLARRFGQRLLDTLDQAYGYRPDPREPFEPPAHFETTVHLLDEIDDTEALIFPLRRLLGELGGFLKARQQGVERFEVRLAHRGGSTPLRLGLVAPSRDPAHLLSLLREHLERMALPAPVQTIHLEATAFQALAPRNLSLFGEEQAPGTNEAMLLERLQARLGPETINGLHAVADHRPERAWRPGEPGDASTTLPAPGPRPLWLLPEPQRLAVIDGRPAKKGPLSLRTGPERIESGWWDSDDVQRDYYVAETAEGERYWIFREPGGEKRWFLHGIFS